MTGRRSVDPWRACGPVVMPSGHLNSASAKCSVGIAIGPNPQRRCLRSVALLRQAPTAAGAVALTALPLRCRGSTPGGGQRGNRRYSSARVNGDAPVSKTESRRFDTCRACEVLPVGRRTWSENATRRPIPKRRGGGMAKGVYRVLPEVHGHWRAQGAVTAPLRLCRFDSCRFHRNKPPYPNGERGPAQTRV